MPHRSSAPLFWRIKKSKYSLLGSKCINCAAVFFPPRTLCPNCRRRGKLIEHQLSGKGEIVSFTKIHTAPDLFEAAVPYTIGIIKLEEGPTVSAQIINNKEIGIGKKVRSVFRKTYENGEAGLLYYGFKFELI